MSRSRLRSGDIQHPFQGVNVVGSALPTLLARCRALAAKLPADTRFCGPTAAILQGLPLPTRLEKSLIVHVAVTRGTRTLVGRGIRGHTYLRTPDDTRMWNGLAISSPERVWCELATELDLGDLVAVGDHLVHRDLPATSIAALGRAIEVWPGRRGMRMLVEAHPLLSERSESRKESQLRVIVKIGGILGVRANYEIRTSSGFTYRGDLAIPERKLIIEYQSGFHNSPEAFRADMTRISRLAMDGWYVMQVNSDDLRDPLELCQRIWQVLADRPTFG
jgi:very-short-patch-repair endonuclease